MDKLQAQNIIKQTFENPFNRERFVGFIKNLLNHIKEAPFTYQGQYIPEAYRGYIQSLERIGKYEADGSKIDILIIKLQKNTSLERARTMQRNFVAWYLNGSRGGELKDAALVAYVAPGDEDWRFSLVKMDYKFTETKTGKMKVKEEFTPARRWSFLVGANEKSHTAQSRLIDILANDEETLSLATLEEAFNIEKVTKEFFEKYRELFLRTYETLESIVKKDHVIKKDFAEKHVDTVDFSKKLLGQIVFLYFLQKKGWFGVPMNKQWGEGDKKFLRTMFDRSQAKNRNYFNDYLEPLFYEALARERTNDFYSRFECKIPFLNGGLFDPINDYDWVNTVINLGNDLFSNTRRTKEGDIGDGILDIFDRYNFTVKEDEPLEKEVAVDPEMLGKVFENLLEVKDRKSSGTYYTPREIVHYMCEQSLINHLATELNDKVDRESIEQFVKHSGEINEQSKKNYPSIYSESISKNARIIDDLLADIKVCDPAIGSGAFPVGMMSEIVKVRIALNKFIKESERTPYHFKRHSIQSSLYGVDIDPGAVEIAKLRLWLSLIVDEDDIKQIKPLPNLDYKIMQGNSLVEEFEGVKLFDEKLISSTGLDTRTLINNLKEEQSELQREYIGLHSQNKLTARKKAELEEALEKINKQIKKLNKPDDNNEAHPGLFDVFSEAKKKLEELKKLQKNLVEATYNKEEIKNKIEKLEWELIEATLKEQGKTFELKKIEEFKNLNTKPFFLWKLNFSEVFQEKSGFNIIIANPPYIGEKGHKELFREVKNGGSLEKFYIGKMDFFYFFFHLAINMGGMNSQIAFITTNYYPTALGAKKLREDFKNRTIIRKLVNFNELKIFKSAMGQHNMLTLLSKNQNSEDIAETCITKRTGEATSEILNAIVSWQDEQTEYFKVKQKDLYDGEENYIRINGNTIMSNNPIQIILEKIKNQGLKLDDVSNVNTGIMGGCDYISQRNINYCSDQEKTKQDIQLGDGVFVLSEENERDKKIINDIKNNEYIKKFYKNSDIKRYYTDRTTAKYIIFSSKENKAYKNNNIKRHLDKFKSILEKNRKINNEDINLFPFLRRGTAHQYIFESEKIVAPQRSPQNTFGYNKIPWYASADVYFITAKENSEIELKYILSMLNSKLYYLWFYHRGKRKGETLELYQKPLSEVPIKLITKDAQKPFIYIVDQILAITKSVDYLQNQEKQAQVRKYEQQINKMVYSLYGLNKEEITIVENEANKD